jgi:hypothetical protein
MKAIRMRQTVLVSLLLAAFCTGCGDDEEKKDGTCTTPGSAAECPAGQVCEEVVGGAPACFAPVSVQGRVFDLATDSGVQGARIVARDANDAAASGVAVSDANGAYSLAVPVPRDASGNPAVTRYTLRADASGYLTFPKAPRLALPVDVSKPVNGIVKTTATDIGLVALESTTGLGSVSGRVLSENPGGALVVAHHATSGTVTALADRDGGYVIFNVPAGSIDVRGYQRDVNLESKTVTVSENARAENVDLALVRSQAVTVNGKVEIVNPGNGKDTSVILTVKDTFEPDVARGEAPPGLRVGGVTGTFSIEGVPDGQYVVLAAFENDFLVRDPDTSIGGTALVEITVAGQNLTLSQSFKITGALDIVSPTAEEVVTGTPTFVFVDDSSEDHYELAVFDAFGHLVWENKAVPGVSGAKNVSVTYAGDALEVGMLYQFRATSIGKGGTPISRTEDLEGVFVYGGN